MGRGIICGFKLLFIFTAYLGKKDSHFDEHIFSDGLETTN